jgi:hypothetical protein
VYAVQLRYVYAIPIPIIAENIATIALINLMTIAAIFQLM